jgi:hypothetical protein
MKTPGPFDSLEDARLLARLSEQELWERYFALTGTASPLTLHAFLQGREKPDTLQLEILVHALNERFLELGENHPVPYPRNGADPGRMGWISRE